MDTADSFEDVGENDEQMNTEQTDEFNEFQVNADEAIEDEFNESVVTKVVVQENERQTKLSADDKTKNELYRNLDVNINDIKNLRNWRLNVIHIRGVQEMSSEDVLSYFTDYMPNSIEWVNDISCNVVFDDDDVAAFVMSDLKTAVVYKGKKYSEIEQCDIDVIDGDTLEMSIPPGRWMLAKPHPKAKLLLLRFANLSETFNLYKCKMMCLLCTEGDRKVKGARNFSEYYLKHGFTNENSAQNDSNSMVQEFRRKINVETSSTSNKNNKVMRMRMRADDEEDKTKRRTKSGLRIQVSNDGLTDSRDVKTTEDRVSIWSRLDAEPQKTLSSTDGGIFGNRARRGVWSRLNQPRTYEPITVTDLRLKLTERKTRFQRNTPY
ncbi:uncharacterized protein B4U80_00361 [Leptotrombidium deliense]|uniref:Nuclear cap-binding protein subunit 3 n=1 Tax=Leptotrombidium deliense TaxID=299467 RepID=A0A443SMK3_9ACAR|nr:uncharacterized protein B4U80_00361 [Leptotrombidium deliense]